MRMQCFSSFFRLITNSGGPLISYFLPPGVAAGSRRWVI
jgi:hypothetical protein